MQKHFLFSLLVLVMALTLHVNILSQQCELTVANISFESTNSLTFDVLINNTGTSSFVYSNGSLAWTYDTAILNGGTATFSLVPSFSDFAAGAHPPSALITNPNVLRTSSNMPGSNGVISVGQNLRLYRFRLQTSVASFASENFNISWKKTVTPFTRIYSWDAGTGLPVEIINPAFSIQAVLLTEDFEYTAGDLLTNHGWLAHSGGGTQPITVNDGGLTYTGYAGSGIGNAALVDNNGEDVNKIFSAQTSGIVYASFMIRVDNYVTSSPSYFLHFGQDDPMNTSNFRGKVFAQKSGTTDLQFGLSFASNTPTLTTVDYSIGSTYLVVLKYQIVDGLQNDLVSIFIFNSSIPQSEPSTPTIGPLTETTGDLANVDAIALRQFNASQNLIVDGIRVATDWTDLFPASGTPTITVSPTILSGFTYFSGGGPSTSQSYNLSASDLTPASGNITVTGSTNYEVSSNDSTFSGNINVAYVGGALGATPVYVRLKAGLSGGTYNGELITNEGGGATTQNVTCNGSVSLPEPTNHVTNFTGVQGIPPYYNIDLSWIDATGGTQPDGYLLKGSSIDFASISAPVDGTPEVNSQLVQNVAQGIQGKIFSLNPATTYFFKIFPYTNSGSLIDYKTDGAVPQVSVTTATVPLLPITENFEYVTGSKLTDNGWIAHSGAGTNPIMVNATPLSYSGYVNSDLGKSVTITTSGEDDNRSFNLDTTGTIYASFMVNISSAQNTGDYFFHLGVANSTSLFFARVYVRKALNDNLAFGLSKSSTNTTIHSVYTDSIYNSGTTYLLVVSYTFSPTVDDTVKLWINPVLNGIEPTPNLIHSAAVSDAVNLGMFALRQGSSLNAASLIFGGLRVAKTWVPEASSNTFSLNLNVSNGWNLLSVPGTNPAGMLVGNWWSNLTGTVYKFNPGSGYAAVTTTTPGEGYWEKNSGASIYNYPSLGVVAHNPISATAGWNLIGGFEDAINVNLLTTSTGNIIYPIYKYNPGSGYATATTLDPGYGYWVKVSQTCTITIPDVLMAKSGKGEVAELLFKEDWGKIIVTDASGSSYTLYGVSGEVNLDSYELPPLPPTGIFDVRFGSGRVAEDINATAQTIEMSGVVYPVTVRVEGMDIRLQDLTGKEMNVNLTSGTSIVINDARIEKLMVSGETIPTVYSLEQNYPNPFNPSTVIEFSLPEDVSNVKLSIYNALGEKVAELVNTNLTAGKYSYQWNAKNVATGLYIYELRTDKFVSVKKMLLLK